ncbi:MAG: hypothetical protein FWC27_09285 [Firmicutes bacterium]|nr:hypothetical protein [Bacillota bacterium]
MGMTCCATHILRGEKSPDALEADIRRAVAAELLPMPPGCNDRTFYLIAPPQSPWATLWEDADYAQSPWLHNLRPAAHAIAEMTGCTALAAEVVDSDFCVCLLCGPDGTEDLLVRGFADEYDYEPGDGQGDLDFWQSLLRLSAQDRAALAGIWEEAEDEDGLFDIAALLGIRYEQLFPFPAQEEFPPEFEVRILRFGGRRAAGKIIQFPRPEG